MKKSIKSVGGRKFSTPIFAPTIFEDPNTWFWKHKAQNRMLLISHDTINDSKALSRGKLHKILGFSGIVIVDSGGYGKNTETDPVAVYKGQLHSGANVGVLLDRVPSARSSSTQQWKTVEDTIRNARVVRRLHGRKKMALECVVQGATEEQREYCIKKLRRPLFEVYGLSVSQLSKWRRYEEAVKRIKALRRAIPKDRLIHCLGCGSRRMMAIMSYFGADIFDSSSYFLLAARGEQYKSVVLCVRRPGRSATCTFCQSVPGKARSVRGRVRNNLIEIEKEIVRIQCAKAHDELPVYLAARLKSRLYRKLETYFGY